MAVAVVEMGRPRIEGKAGNMGQETKPMWIEMGVQRKVDGDSILSMLCKVSKEIMKLGC